MGLGVVNILILPGSGGSLSGLRPEAEIYIGLANAGHRVTLITDIEQEYAPNYIENGIKLIHCPPKRKISLKAIRLVRETIKKYNIDIVFATTSRTIPNAAFGSVGTTAKMVAYRGTTGGLYRRDPSTYLSLLHPRVDGVVCVSHAVEKYVRKRMWKSKLDNVVAIYKGHNLAWYTRPKTDLFEFNSHTGNFNVVCVANARPIKGLIYLIRAAQMLADLDKLHIILVGMNISTELYLSAIQKTGMGGRIHITGYRHDAPEIISACDVLVSPSIREGFPKAILESLAYKTPVITSANEGSMEIIDDNVNGYVIPLRDHISIAEKIRHAYNNPTDLKRLSDNCQDKFKHEFAHERTIRKYTEYFESLLLA